MKFNILFSEEYDGKGNGVGFIKSRKAPAKIAEMEADLEREAEAKGIQMMHVITDPSSGVDVDRFSIDNLAEWLERDYINVLVVYSIYDITKDYDDLVEFMFMAIEQGVTVVSIDEDFQMLELIPKLEEK